MYSFTLIWYQSLVDLWISFSQTWGWLCANSISSSSSNLHSVYSNRSKASSFFCLVLVPFYFLKVPRFCNAIIRWLLLYEIRDIVSTFDLKVKFPLSWSLCISPTSFESTFVDVDLLEDVMKQDVTGALIVNKRPRILKFAIIIIPLSHRYGVVELLRDHQKKGKHRVGFHMWFLGS